MSMSNRIITVNDLQDYEITGTDLVFDRKLKEVYGRAKCYNHMAPNYRVYELTKEEIEICNSSGFTYIYKNIPDASISLGHCIICSSLSSGRYSDPSYRTNWMCKNLHEYDGIIIGCIRFCSTQTSGQISGAGRSFPLCERCKEILNVEKGLIDGSLFFNGSIESFRVYFNKKRQLSEQISNIKKQNEIFGNDIEENKRNIKLLELSVREEKEKRTESENQLVKMKIECQKYLEEIQSLKTLVETIGNNIEDERLNVEILRLSLQEEKQKRIISENLLDAERNKFQDHIRGIFVRLLILFTIYCFYSFFRLWAE